MVAGGWYLDCYHGFVPEAEKSLFNTLIAFGPKVIELEEEPDENDNLAPSTNVKEVGSAKGKDKGKRVASSHVSTRSNSKASVQRTPTLVTTVVDSPTATSSAVAPDLLHSDVALPSVPRKKKAVAPDTSTTSSEKSSSLFLIENVDMEELIEDLMKTKIQPPAYRCIQEFITKVFSVLLLYFFLSYTSTIIFFILFEILFLRLERVILVQTPNPSITQINLLFADVPKNLRVPSISASPSNAPRWN